MALRGIIFDLDGTLGDTLPICVEAFRRAGQELTGRVYSDEEIMATFGPSEEGSVGKLTPGQEEEGLRRYLHHYEELHHTCQAPFVGVSELLSELDTAGVRLGLVTGKGAGSARISMRVLGLDGVFEHVEVGSPEGGRKAEAIDAIVNDWNLPADEVAYVGDSPSDVRAARQCGVRMVAAAWASMTDADRLSRLEPDALFTHVGDFVTWVRGQVD